jgi:hypothetical protein
MRLGRLQSQSGHSGEDNLCPVGNQTLMACLSRPWPSQYSNGLKSGLLIPLKCGACCFFVGGLTGVLIIEPKTEPIMGHDSKLFYCCYAVALHQNLRLQDAGIGSMKMPI